MVKENKILKDSFINRDMKHRGIKSSNKNMGLQITFIILFLLLIYVEGLPH